MKTKDRKKYIILIMFIIIILIVIAIFNNNQILKKEEQSIDKKIETSLVSTQNSEQEEKKDTTQDEEINTIQSENSINTEENILTTYKGYSVIAKLEIPKIELETYVISEYSEEALGVSVTKFYGGEPNEVGNFCIAGHNYIANNMFHDLKKLSNGDRIILIDSQNKDVIYEIYSIETVEPNETKCLSQKTNGRTELTLITCTTDSSKRIIVKAVKI